MWRRKLCDVCRRRRLSLLAEIFALVESKHLFTYPVQEPAETSCHQRLFARRIEES
jgi:hypothetical protein